MSRPVLCSCDVVKSQVEAKLSTLAMFTCKTLLYFRFLNAKNLDMIYYNFVQITHIELDSIDHSLVERI